MTRSAPVFDVVIAGGAVYGLALAAALKQALGDGVKVAIVDPAPARSSRPPLRTVAIAEGPRLLIERIGAWEAIEPKAQAIVRMDIMDGGVRDAIRLRHLHFDAKPGAPLAHMAFNDDVHGGARVALRAARSRADRRRGRPLPPRPTGGGDRPRRRAAADDPPRGRGRRGAIEAPDACRYSRLRMGL